MTSSRILMMSLALTALTACKPDVEVKISQEQIISVAQSGEPEEIDFEVEISQQHIEIDDEKRAQIEGMQEVLERHFPDADVEVTIGAKEYEIEVDGELVLANEPGQIQAPWGFIVYDVSSENTQQYTVYLAKGTSWAQFSDDIFGVLKYFRPNDFLELDVKLRDASGLVVGGGFTVDGTPLSGYASVEFNQPTNATLSFSGMHWHDAPAGFFFIPKTE